MSRLKSDKPPKSTRQYEKRMKETLRDIVREKPLEQLTNWDLEILNSCVERGYIINIVFSRNEEGNPLKQIRGKAIRVTLDGYSFLDRMSADKKSTVALWLSVLSVVASIISIFVGANL